jgi:MarR family transcriptional regulator, lower aerobic nicotinate degradation pathway regulator
MSSPITAPPETYDPRVSQILCERLGFLFAKLHHRVSAESIRALREAGLGLTGLHMGALSVVDSAGPMSQQTLGEHLKKDRTTIVAIVDELEGEGLVERRRNPDDRRAYALEVTAKGRDWLSRAQPVLATTDAELLADLDPEEQRALLELLQRVLLGPAPQD